MAKTAQYPAPDPVVDHVPKSGERGVWLQLRRDAQPYPGDASVSVGDVNLAPRGGGVFAGEVAPGRYRLTVTLAEPGLVAPPRTIQVGTFASRLAIDVLSVDQPVIHFGGEPQEFRPAPGRVGVTFPPKVGPAARAAFALEVSRKLGLRRIDPDSGSSNVGRWRPPARLAFALPDGKLPDRELLAALRSLALAAGAGPDQVRIGALHSAPGSEPQLVVDDQFVVGFRHDSGADAIADVLAKLEATPLRQVGQCPPALRVRLADAAEPAGFARRLGQLAELVDKGVLTFAEPALPVPGEPAGPAAALAAQVNYSNHGVPAVWGRSITGNGVSIGHIDSPVVTSHPGVQRNGTPWGSHTVLSNASGSHGTRTFGLISAQGDGGLWGIAPDAWPVSVGIPLKAGAKYDLVSELEQALTICRDQLVRVVSMSFAYLSAGLSTTTANLLDDMVNVRGMLLVKAAGNADSQLGSVSSRSTSTAPVVQDALCQSPLTVCVADVDTSDTPTTSNLGECVDFCAQGTLSLTLKASGGTVAFGESSAATAIVAATLALMISAKPTITRFQALDILAATAVRPASSAWADVVPPWGGPARPHHLRFGYGRINADAAVAAAQALP